MEIICSDCKYKLNISGEKLRAFKSNFTLPCPGCKKHLEINVQSNRESLGLDPVQNEESKEPPSSASSSNAQATGDELKEEILKTIDDLPPMPQVAQKARKVISNPDSNFKDLAKVIETDQAIATKVLKMANSAYYGFVGDVSSVQQASVVLGTKTLVELLNLACASGPLSKTLKGYELESGDLWKHSLAVAAGSRIIAKKKRAEFAEDAFSAGLIHDVGKLILDPYIFERKEAFESAVLGGNESFFSAEKNILGFDHGEIASEVCDKWQIPQHLSLAIKNHHDPMNSNGDELACIIHLADVTAMMTGIGGGLDGMMYKIDEKVMDSLEFGHTDITMLMGEISEYVEKTVGGE